MVPPLQGASAPHSAPAHPCGLRLHPEGTTLRAILPANLACIEALCQATREHIARNGAAEQSFSLILGLRETLLNAIMHGSAGNAAAMVQVELDVQPDQAHLMVEDQGPGFDWRSRSFAPPPPDAVSGRGLPIVSSCFDEIEFNHCGNRIRLSKRFRSDGPMSGSIRQGETVRLMPRRDIVAATAQGLKQELKTLVDGGAKRLELDCTEVEMVDSVGIGLLVATHNSLKLQGGGLVLRHVSADVAGLLQTMRLDKHFEILAD
ncbi:ATP-binding protein [Megalodesulfovibrio paquesii]